MAEVFASLPTELLVELSRFLDQSSRSTLPFLSKRFSLIFSNRPYPPELLAVEAASLGYTRLLEWTLKTNPPDDDRWPEVRHLYTGSYPLLP